MSASTQEPEATLLVVEDETNIRELLTTSLRFAGFEVHAAPDGRTALQLAGEHEIDLAVLDIMLPDMDGFSVTRTLRERGADLPIVFLTARDSLDDKVKGLTVGGDDYVTKPFSHRELVARIRAVLRRGQDQVLLPEVVEVDGVRIDVERHQVTVDGKDVRFALREFELLELLLRNAGRVMTRGQLIDRIWGSDYVGDTKTLDVHIKRLRSKIEKDPSNPQRLITVRGLGYKYEG